MLCEKYAFCPIKELRKKIQGRRDELDKIHRLVSKTQDEQQLAMYEERANEYHTHIESLHAEMYELDTCLGSPDLCD